MRQHHPYDLGTAIYKALSGGRSPNTEPTSFGDALGYFVKAAGGNVSAAARLMGVPRRSLRDWLGGVSTPKGDRRRDVARSAQLSARRQRLTPRSEARVRGRDPQGMTLVGRYNYDFLDGVTEARRCQIGPYLDDDTVPELVDAYLSGASPADLRALFASKINDPSDFYSRTMALPPTDDHGWTVSSFHF
jgi:hypothetical protein